VPDAERCRKASREGTSRVFEARGGDKPRLPYLARDLRNEITCIGHQEDVKATLYDTQLESVSGIVSYARKVTFMHLSRNR